MASPGIEERIHDLMEEHLDCPREMITPTARLVEDLNLTPLDRETLRLLVNREFALEIPADEARTFTTVEEIVGYVLERKT